LITCRLGLLSAHFYATARVASILAAAFGILSACSTLGALAAGKPAIVMPPTVQVPSPSEVEFAVRIEDAESAPPASVVLISGLPPDVTFSAGRAVVRGTWEVPLAAIAGLRVKIPAEVKGRSDLVILLTHNSDKYTVVLASARSALVVDAATSRSEQALAPQAGEGRKEEARLAEEQRKAEEARKLAEARRAEEERRVAEAKRAEEARLAEEQTKGEEARKLAEARKAEEERRIAEAKRAEEARLAEEQRKAEEQRQAEVARKAEEARKLAEARKAEEGRRIAEAKRAEEARLAEEQRKAEEVRKLAEARKAEEERRIAEAKRAEEARLAEEQRKAEEQRQAEVASKAEEARKLAEARKAEEERRSTAEAQRVAAAGKQADERAAAEQRAAALNQGSGPKEPTPTLPQARLDHLLAQGDRHLSDGNIVIARQYYLRAAQAGMARAALRLAETYDPNELRRLNVKGLLPDVAEAKRWYVQAVALGETGAQIKLGRLQEK
jgi:hypothetical protein